MVADETPQSGQVYPVLFEVLALRSLQNFWHSGETTIIHKTAEGVETDKPLADVHVPVDTASEILLAVVYVKSSHAPGSDQTIKLPDGLPVTLFGPDIVARGEEMTRIQADADALLVANLIDHCRQMLKPMPETTSLASGILKQDFYGSGRGVQRAIKRGCNARDAGFLAGAHVSPRMENHVGHAEKIRPFHLLDERAQRLLV